MATVANLDFTKLSKGSRPQYQRGIKHLLGLLKIENFTLIKNNPKQVIDVIMKEYSKFETLKKQFTYLLFATKQLGEHYDRAYGIYEKKFKELRTQIQERTDENQKTEKQAINWMSWEELNHSVEKAKVLEWKDDDLLIVALFTKLPPLRPENYADLKITKKLNKKQGNQLVITKKTMKLFFTDYKKQAKEALGDVILPIKQKDVIELIKKSIANHPDRKTLFGDMKARDIGVKFSELMDKITGKNITIQLARTIYTTNLMKDPNYMKLSIAKRNELHRQLLHSRAVAESTYFKLD